MDTKMRKMYEITSCTVNAWPTRKNNQSGHKHIIIKNKKK